MSKLLLFSLLVCSTFAFADVARNSEAPTSPDASVATAGSPFAAMPQGLNASADNQTNISEQTRTCLRIHAFIFKTDDDRVPQLVRETTCMPAGGPVLKKVNGNVQPKLVPATGGDSF